jgi:hypothetical protein
MASLSLQWDHLIAAVIVLFYVTNFVVDCWPCLAAGIYGWQVYMAALFVSRAGVC